jgi:hypothetical protein
MSYTTNISPGSPPLLWSNIDEAFRQINQNFTELQLYINDSSFSPIDLTNLYSDLSPGDSNMYKIGNQLSTWKSIYLSEYLGTDADVLNGLWLGQAHIKGIGLTVDLPENSTIDGDLIVDPDRTFFKTVSVNGTAVQALDFNSTLTLNQGTGITLTGTAETESIQITNSGVTAITAGTAISINQSTGNVTVTNNGVRSLTNTTTLPTGRTSGVGIAVNQSNGDVTVTNTGILAVTGGTGITVSTDVATGEATVNIAFGIPLAFRNIQVPGQDTLVADTVADTLVMEPGYGILITTSELVTGEDTLTFSLDPRIDITGSVYADDSTVMVDAIDRKLYGELTGNVIGNVTGDLTGNVTGNLTGNVIGDITGNVTGNVLGSLTGDVKGSVFGDDSSLIVDSVDQKVYANSGFFGNLTGDVRGSIFGDDSTKIVDAVENEVSANKIVTPRVENSSTLTLFSNADIVLNASTSAYLQSSNGNFDIVASNGYAALSDASGAGNILISDLDGSINLGSTGTITIQGAAGSAINIGVGTSGNVTVGNGSNQLIINGTLMVPIIDTIDSSAITVVPPVNFNTDVNFENELFIKNSRVMSIAELQSIVAASTNFADFQARIASL